MIHKKNSFLEVNFIDIHVEMRFSIEKYERKDKNAAAENDINY